MNASDIFEMSNMFAQYDALFYNAWLLGKPTIVRGNEIQTACVKFSEDGSAIEYCFNEDFWNSLNKHERAFVFAHEILHVFFNHGARVNKAQITERHNIAMDIVINHTLISKYGFDLNLMPKLRKEICLIENVFDKATQPSIERDQNFEYYYNKLPANMPSGRWIILSNLSDLNDLMEQLSHNVGQNLSKEDLDKINEIVKKHSPAGTEEAFNVKDFSHIKKVRKKKTWSQLIKSIMSAFSLSYKLVDKWSPRARRIQHLANDLFLPSELEDEEVEKNKPTLYIYLDTSGSCYHDSERFYKAMKSISTEDFHIFYFGFDTSVYEIKNDKFYGFGGTSFSIIENHIKKYSSKYPDMVFVITDGDGTHVSPQYPKRWHWFLTDECGYDSYYDHLIPKDSKTHKLRDFE